MNPAHNPVYPI